MVRGVVVGAAASPLSCSSGGNGSLTVMVFRLCIETLQGNLF
jgi:hypothetical protein